MEGPQIYNQGSGHRIETLEPNRAASRVLWRTYRGVKQGSSFSLSAIRWGSGKGTSSSTTVPKAQQGITVRLSNYVTISVLRSCGRPCVVYVSYASTLTCL